MKKNSDIEDLYKGSGGGPAAHRAALFDRNAGQHQLPEEDSCSVYCYSAIPLLLLVASLSLFAYNSSTSQDQSASTFRTPITLLVLAFIIGCVMCLGQRNVRIEMRNDTNSIFTATQQRIDQFSESTGDEKEEEKNLKI